MLVLMVFASFALVMGVVLLSNDMRHLRSLMRYFGHDLPVRQTEAKKPVVETTPKTARPILAPTIKLPAHIFEEPKLAAIGAFISGWRISGPDLCDRLRRVGLDATPWSTSQFNDKNFECSFEHVYQKDGDVTVSSFFLVVRGDEQGRITMIRAKFVKPPRDNAGRLAPAAFGFLDELFVLSHWPDCGGASTVVRSLKDIKISCSGKVLDFTQEPMNPGSYNFFLSLKPDSVEETRSAAYFTPDRWLKGPDAPPSDIPSVVTRG